MLSFLLNRDLVTVNVPPATVLLDFIRDHCGLPGTKEACREGECGACTVLVGRIHSDGSVRYAAVASCIMPVAEVDGCHVVTVEGVNMNEPNLIQKLIIDHSASQCGFCTPGIVMSLAGYCLTSASFAFDDAVDALDGNLCRCTGYASIRAAARALSERLASGSSDLTTRVEMLVAAGVLPEYFRDVPRRMGEFPTAPSPARTDDTVIVAGGTDLFVQKPEELLEREICLVSRMPGLDRIRVDGSTLRIGAAVSLEEFRLSPLVLDRFPSMKGDLLLHSSTILRNKATLAGNVVNASPIGDMTIILLALDASLVIQNREGKSREVALREFYKGYKKFDLACGEILSEIAIPPLDGAHFNFEKISNRTILDIAAVNSACVIKFDPSGAISELRISAGGVAPVPMLIPGLDLLHGRKPNSSAADAAAEIAMAAVTPIDDIRGTAQYKRLLLGNLVRLHFDSFSKMEARS